MKMSILDRILLLIATLLAAYQIAVGIDGLSTVPTIAYSIAFGVILVAGLLLIIFGLEVLDSPIVAIVSSLIPLSLATGLVWHHLPFFKVQYLVFAILWLLIIVITRVFHAPNKLSLFVLIVVHGVLLALLNAGKPLLSHESIFRVLPGLLLLMTATLVAGFALST